MFTLRCGRKVTIPFIGLSIFVAWLSAAETAARAADEPAPAAGVVRHNLRLSDFNVHDPWILAHAPTKTYYLYTSNNARATGVNRPGTIAYRSKDLLNWEGPQVVFTLPQGTWAANQPAWAPEVHEYKGRYYLFTTLHNPEKVIAAPPAVWKTTHMRGTVTAASQSPEGPFTLLKTDGPVPPADFMTLDGTFYVDRSGKPWMVYAHEWIQKIDGTMEAVPLKEDLSAASGAPIYLFKGSDAPWLNEQGTASTKDNHYVTDGPELFRTRDGHLLMLWSSYDNSGYVQTVARSKSGELKGPWEQLPPLVRGDSGHGMLFHTFDGQLMMVLHRPFRRAHAKLYEMQDEGDHLRILRERNDLDGDRSEVQTRSDAKDGRDTEQQVAETVKMYLEFHKWIPPPKPEPIAEDQIKSLIRGLVSPNKAPLIPASGTAKYPKGSTPGRYRHPRSWTKLEQAGLQAFPNLFEALGDKRYSFTEDAGSGDDNWTVGQACFDIIRCQIEPLCQIQVPGDNVNVRNRPRYTAHFLHDSAAAKAWWQTHKQKSIRELQIEVLEWTIAEEAKKPADYSRAERTYLQAILTKLRDGNVVLPSAVPWSR